MNNILAYKICKNANPTLSTIESNIVHHGPRLILVICVQKTNQLRICIKKYGKATFQTYTIQILCLKKFGVMPRAQFC